MIVVDTKSKSILDQFKSVIQPGDLWISALSQTCAFLYHNYLNANNDHSIFNWVGFYLFDATGNRLILGPFQGKLACTEIPVGRGVVGSCAERGEMIYVPRVELFPGHIACDAESKSEIVIPVFDHNGKFVAVLDIDSTEEDCCSCCPEIIDTLLSIASHLSCALDCGELLK